MRILSALILAMMWFAAPAAAQGRLALVIGNSGYQSGALPNPKNDAALMAETLRKSGFQVTELLDVGQRDMKIAIRDFGQALRADNIDAGLFFYAGHGVQVRGVNYLIPVGVSIQNEDDVAIEAVSVDDFLEQMNSSKSKINIVILDACRDNPFARSTRSGARGLAAVQAPAGTFIAYSTAPGAVAEDGNGANSPYSAALAKSIAASDGRTIESVFKSVRQSLRDTGASQVPWEASSIVGDFYFRPQAAASIGPAPGVAPKTDDATAAWNMISNSTDPADFQSFIEAYGAGNSFLKQQAEKRLRSLKGGGAVAMQRPPPPVGASQPDPPAAADGAGKNLAQQIAQLRAGKSEAAKTVGQNGRWTIYAAKQGAQVKCWAWVAPTSVKPATGGSVAVHLGVDKFGAGYTPSVILPGKASLLDPPKAEVGGRSFLAMPIGNVGFFSMSDSGQDMVGAMAGGAVKISATLQNGKKVEYGFDTTGIAAVINSMASCD